MTTAKRKGEQETSVEVVSPDEALRRAKPLQSREQLVVQGVADEQWDAFFNAISRK